MVRCTKCWCPENLGHNVGCPNHPQALSTAQADYDRGYRDGFAEESDWYPSNNKSYNYGFRSGKAEIDRLVDDEAQSRCFG